MGEEKTEQELAQLPAWQRKVHERMLQKQRAQVQEQQQEQEQEQQVQDAGASSSSSSDSSNNSSNSGSSSNSSNSSNTDNTGSLNLRQERYIQGILETQAKELAATPEGSRNQRLFDAALKCGSYLHYGVITKQQVTSALVQAYKACGGFKDDGRAQTLKTINGGISTAKPRDLPAELSHLSYTSADPEIESLNNPDTWAEEYKKITGDTESTGNTESTENTGDTESTESTEGNNAGSVPRNTATGRHSANNADDNTSTRHDDKSGNHTCSSTGAVTPVGAVHNPAGAVNTGATSPVNTSNQYQIRFAAPGELVPPALENLDPNQKNFPHEIFDESEILKAIQQYSFSKMIVSPLMLASVLARVLLEAGPHVMLPASMGDVAGLNLGFNMVGRSGLGKSSSFSGSMKLMAVEQEHLTRNIGSGEGLTEIFLTRSSKSGPALLVSDPRRLVNVDEVEKFQQLMDRSGSTIGADLRSALTGGMLGASNADAGGRNRHVAANSYRLIVMLSSQPLKTEFLLKSADSGLPQRFLWMGLSGKEQPERLPVEPNPFYWRSPWPDDSSGGYTLDVATAVHEEMFAQRMQYIREGKEAPDELSHINLTRLKVSAALAALHGELDISKYWWDLGGLLTQHSLDVQEQCRQELQELAARENAKRAFARGKAQTVTETVVENHALETLKKKVISKLRAWSKTNPGEYMIYRDLQQKFSSKQREILAECLDALVEENLIESFANCGRGGRSLGYKLVRV